jgi:CRP/FNR family transcriptional regulator, anaerobic regulatory protein
MKSLIGIIKQSVSLSEEEVELLQKLISVQKLSKNSFFIKEGQICNRLAFVESGMFRHFYHTDEKAEVTRWVSLSNTFFTAFESFIMQIPSYENIQALKDSIICTIFKKDWHLLCDKIPFIKDLWAKNIEFHYMGMEERVYSLIALRAEKRYDLMCKKYPEFIEAVPLKYIASMLGIEPRHLSRIRKNFIEK